MKKKPNKTKKLYTKNLQLHIPTGNVMSTTFMNIKGYDRRDFIGLGRFKILPKEDVVSELSFENKRYCIYSSNERRLLTKRLLNENQIAQIVAHKLLNLTSWQEEKRNNPPF